MFFHFFYIDVAVDLLQIKEFVYRQKWVYMYLCMYDYQIAVCVCVCVCVCVFVCACVRMIVI